MKTYTILITLTFLFSITNLNAVEKGNGRLASNGTIKEASKDLSIPIVNMTKPDVIFLKYKGSNCTGAFLISEHGEYFMALYLNRANSQNFKILEEQKLVITFDNNVELTLNSFRDVESKILGLSANKSLWIAYKINIDQIKVFTENTYRNIKIYFTSDSELTTKVNQDDSGKFFEFEIKGGSFQKSMQNPAKCILQIN
jgi:hypothetical protein